MASPMMSAGTATTLTDQLQYQWAIGDPVIQVRRWATVEIHALEPLATVRGAKGKVVIGRDRKCQIVLDDPACHTSAFHAELEQEHGHWIISDKSKNGVYLDNEKRDRGVLLPGAQVRCGPVTFVAESVRLIALRNALSRMLGWAANRRAVIDLALQAIRLAATRRTTLVLCGSTDLLPIAKELHELTLGTRPFVVCRRKALPTGEITAPCFSSGLDALAAARNGTVCIDGQPPRDLMALLLQQRAPESTTQLMVCQEHKHEPETFPGMPIEIPALSTRRRELDVVIDEYAAIGASQLGMTRFDVTPTERAWLRKDASRSLGEIQVATLRLAALRLGKSRRRAAEILKLHHKSLGKWLRNHNYPDVLEDSDE